MTTTQKALKDKPTAPKLAPRPTAASAARAARNATNRNLLPPQAQRQSPSRSVILPKAKNGSPRVQPKNDSKADFKDISNAEIIDSLEHDSAKTDHDSYIIDNASVVILEETSKEKLSFGLENSINHNEANTYENTLQEENFAVNQNIDGVTTHQKANSTPHTPVVISRPTTPKSLQSSRPQTPRMLSRPTTPVCSRQATPASRPNTPQAQLPGPNKLATSPRQPSEKAPLSKSLEKPPVNLNKEEDIKAVFVLQQKQFKDLKKDLDLKQQAVLEAFNSLRGLRDLMCQEGLGGGEGLSQQELVVFNVADWAAEELSQLCRDAIASAASDGAFDLLNNVAPFDECALAEFVGKVTDVPTRFADMCLQAFSARQEIIDWVKELVEKYEIEDEAMNRIARYNAQGLELCETLRELKSCADRAVETVANLTKRACQERSALTSVGESLVREIAQLRKDLEATTATLNESRKTKNDGEAMRLLEETRRELEEERSARTATKDKLSTTECQLRQTKMRVTKMDRQLREAEASIASLTGTVKSLEDQSRQKEIQLEARARKLKESLKTGEVTSSHIAQQRDALQAEVSDLQERIQNMTKQHKSAIDDLINQLKQVNVALEEQKVALQQEVEQKMNLEATIEANQITIEELRAKITELENSKPNPDLPTEREMDLWAELQATKDVLRATEEEITACKRDKVRFLETMTKITETDNKVDMQQKLAAELLSKEEIIGKMQHQIRELTKSFKLNEQKVAQYEQYIREMQEHKRAVANCQEESNGVSYDDLQQEIMNLRMSLLEAAHQNEGLSEMLAQKEQQLEQQDKTSRAQARVIKVREELINMLKNKETEQSRELTTLQQDLEHRMNIVGEVNKQISAKKEEIQELFATLENKQQQIHRLEKIVLALEEQQRRAQAQRTRQEEKIAALEHELAAGGNRRERKFLFF